MSLTFKQKFTDSWRGDHSDFGDVQKTTFAKGVISDFETIQPDPFRVRSMCKVTGDWGESEYIPIYYHPKPQYWDDDTTLATTFNEDNQYFEKAWMSFRCGDEVKVMLREGVPAFVIAFADGTPWPGENIVKIDDNGSIRFWQAFKQESYGGAAGLDGMPLPLTELCQYVVGPRQTRVLRTPYCQSPAHADPIGSENIIPDNNTYLVRNIDMKLTVTVIIIGPIIYALYAIWGRETGVYHFEQVFEPVIETLFICPTGPSVPVGQENYVLDESGVLAGVYNSDLLDTVLNVGGFNVVQIYENSIGHSGENFMPPIDGLVWQNSLYNNALLFNFSGLIDKINYYTVPHNPA